MGLVAGYLAVCWIGGAFFAEASMKWTQQPLNPVLVAKVQERVALQSATLKDVAIQSPEGLTLRGWLVVPHHPNGDAIILLHGVSDSRLGVAGFGELFLSHGYTILLPDARHHGQSEGEIATFGVREAEDVHRWVDLLEDQSSPKCVYGFGESMGAATVLQSLKYEQRFCGVIAESPFAEMREGAYDRLALHFHIPEWTARSLLRPSVWAGETWARLHYGVDLSQASPRKAVQNSTTPVLLIHGQRDVNILPENSMLIRNANPKRVEYWSVPGAAHCGAWITQPQEFERRVLGFVAAHKATATAPLPPGFTSLMSTNSVG